MNRNDEEWFGELSRNPFPKKGFTPELQRKIMREFDRKPVSKRRFYPIAGAALLLVILVFAGYRLAVEPTPEEISQTASVAIHEIAGTPEKTPDIRSVLMLGLRSDAKSSSPAYRTLVIAEQEGKMKTVAEGGGILMPYGQQFWRITSNENALGTGAALQARRIDADSASVSASAVNAVSAANTVVEPTVVSQALLFAGNRYLTLEEKDQSANQGSQIHTRTVDLKAYAASTTGATGFHLDEVAGITGTSALADWMLFRKEGRWQVAEESSGGGIFSPSGKEFSLIPAILPESLTAYDSLNLTWEQVLKLEPDAKDAVSSPDKDMLAVLTTDKVVIYTFPSEKDNTAKKLLTVDKSNLESLVMSEWATEKYADKWIKAGIDALGAK
ncbi:hypothetical protein [Gorillibacterium massiliense]|uniref:hypothetical protein n=1 Tax=Gorillibacterium massiliense TaxID=1280390 RepID=UPI0004B77C94|nr:hypothetical protein [Gorillibacterium massiliense]